jgi:hypothetical protein
MRYRAGIDANILRRAAMGPAAIAQRALDSQKINLGLRPRPYLRGLDLTHGGSLGCCGLGSYLSGGLGGNLPPPVIIGPIAARMIVLRRAGATPQAALMDAMTLLTAQGVKTVSPEIHLQLAAGLQPMSAYGNIGAGASLGSLGFSQGVGAGITGGTLAASGVGTAAVTAGASAVGIAATGTGIGAGLLIGQTAIPIPVVGAAIGVIVWAAMHFAQRHVGKAEASWTSPGFYASLRTTQGRDYDEKQFSEAFKGMMDTGNNIVPGCGPDRHKDPDCLLGPMAAVIAQGYLSNAVPLTATTAQVFNTVVKPWLMSGAGGLVNARTLASEPIQMLMMQAATDRYLAGQAMTRGDMPSYGNLGAHTPPLIQALQPILQQATTTTPQQQPSNAGGPAYTPAMPPNTVTTQDPSAGGAPPIYPLMPAQSPQQNFFPPQVSGGPGPAIGTQLLPGQSAPQSGNSLPLATQAGFGGGLPSWLLWGVALVGVGFVFFRQGPAPKELFK